MENLFLGNNQWLLLLHPGDELMQSIQNFAKNNNIYSAKIEGIGAIRNAEVGFVDQETKIYKRKAFIGNMELISTTGNITKLETGEPFVHIHISFSEDRNYKLLGGHCFSAEIGAVGEIIITKFENEINRSLPTCGEFCAINI